MSARSQRVISEFNEKQNEQPQHVSAFSVKNEAITVVDGASAP
jgi:hypothetical protein